MGIASQLFSSTISRRDPDQQSDLPSSPPDDEEMRAKANHVGGILLDQGFDVSEGHCDGAKALAIQRGLDPTRIEGVDFLKPRRGTGISELVGIARRAGNPPGNYYVVRGEFEAGQVTKLQRIKLDDFLAQIGQTDVLAFFDNLARAEAGANDPMRPENK